MPDTPAHLRSQLKVESGKWKVIFLWILQWKPTSFQAHSTREIWNQIPTYSNNPYPEARKASILFHWSPLGKYSIWNENQPCSVPAVLQPDWHRCLYHIVEAGLTSGIPSSHYAGICTASQFELQNDSFFPLRRFSSGFLRNFQLSTFNFPFKNVWLITRSHTHI